jgi:hypothetical protein
VDGQITAIYSLCDDVLKTLHHAEDPQCRMNDAEVMTPAIVAALYFGGNLERARRLLASPTYIPRMLSKSRFNRRLHAIELFVPGIGGGLQPAQCQFGLPHRQFPPPGLR